LVARNRELELQLAKLQCCLSRYSTALDS